MMCKMSITHWRSLAATWLLLIAAGCGNPPSGPITSEVRGADAFHSIDLRGAADLSVLVGAVGSVAVIGDAATLERTVTRVQHGVLIVENESAWTFLGGRGKVEIRVTMPSLNTLSLNGAGNVSINGISGDGLSLVLQGAGNLEASGKTAALNARMNGAGNMDLSHLVAGDATVAVNGAGNLSAHVTGSLQASVNGVGSITYAGNPGKVSTEINGVGSIKPAQPGNPAASVDSNSSSTGTP
jgi:hypothetical protein